MAAVHDPSMRFGKDIVSTYSDNPEEGAWAHQLYNSYLSSASPKVTSITLHLECNNWLSHGFSVPVNDPEGITESRAIDFIKNEYPVCPKCGKSWKSIQS